MGWAKTKWNSLEYKTKFYIFLTAGVALLFASVFFIAHLRFYQNGANIVALTGSTGEAVTVPGSGIVTVINAYPLFQWMGEVPEQSISEAELPYQANGSYTITGSLENTCLRLIQAGFLFDTDYGGTTLVSKDKICYLFTSDRTLIATIENLGGEEK